MEILHSFLKDSFVRTQGEEFLQAIQYFSRRNWMPATSSNFSFLHPEGNKLILTQSGKDKNELKFNDLMLCRLDGEVIEPVAAKPSAETLIHLNIYKTCSEIKCVLHTHSQYGTLLSRQYLNKGYIEFLDYEISKAFPGVDNHNHITRLRVISNSQDMEKIWKDWIAVSRQEEKSEVGFLIAGHGLYAWGDSICSARRHLEAYEFLLENKFYEISLNRKNTVR